jgi:SARP family transcriptional regulator, regulator of embCAB operon
MRGRQVATPKVDSVKWQTTDGAVFRISLLGDFSFQACGLDQPLGSGSRRLLALLALRGQRMRRSMVAGMLWPEADEVRAGACLRAALSRLGQARPCVHCSDIKQLSLHPRVRVDLPAVQADARRLLAGDAAPSEADRRGDSAQRLSLDLLPGWYDDWALIAAEEWRQLRIHALEALSARLSAASCHAQAILAAVAAVSADPLRESARSVLIHAYLAEGNRSDALREFRTYRHLLRCEVGVEPTPRLCALVQVGL